ncbi:MAG: LruC domain-containing protein [Prevotellaceae bacterium]|jgi:hypothetical protein|nr:LruC domain-containing protein [Prevotellaceae bacterium]
MKRIIFLTTVAISLLATSCRQDAYKIPENQKDFALSGKISVNIQTPPIDSARVSIFTENPYNEYGDIIVTPVLTGYTPVNKQITVPISTTKLYVTIDDVLRTFDRGDINYSGSILPETATKAVEDATAIPIDDGIWNKVTSIYPENMTNVSSSSLTTCTDLVVQADNSEAWVSFLSGGGDNASRVYFYTYREGDTTPPALSEDNLIFDNITKTTAPNLGTRKYLGKFNKGEIVGFAVVSDEKDLAGGTDKEAKDFIKYSTPQFNSNPFVSSTSIPTSGSASLVNATMGIIRTIEYLGQEYQTYGAEDFYGWADLDYNDVIFLIESTPPMKPMNVLESPDKETGRTIVEGIWLFEDNYPYEGDYDFNDAVIHYYIEEPDNAPSISNVFLRVSAIGAQFYNEFGINGQWLISDGSLTGYKNVYMSQPKVETTIREFQIPRAAEYNPELNNGSHIASKESQNIYNANYPYVLDIPASTTFRWCQEGKRIDLAYSKYQSWVDNGCGTTDSDWYKYPNISLIYNK